jgi:hypothetical protein
LTRPPLRALTSALRALERGHRGRPAGESPA